jgi:hypothetical protein
MQKLYLRGKGVGGLLPVLRQDFLNKTQAVQLLSRPIVGVENTNNWQKNIP